MFRELLRAKLESTRSGCLGYSSMGRQRGLGEEHTGQVVDRMIKHEGVVSIHPEPCVKYSVGPGEFLLQKDFRVRCWLKPWTSSSECSIARL